MRFLRQSTAATVKVGPIVDSTDASAETGLTIQKADVRLSKNGGNMAAAAADQGASDAGAPHDELGMYDISLGTGDTDTCGHLLVAIGESGTLVISQDFHVVDANTYTSLFGGTTYLETNPGKFATSGNTLSLKNRAGTEDSTRTIASATADPITGLS